MKKRFLAIVILLVAVSVGVGAYYVRRPTAGPDVRTVQVTRGDIVDVVSATGTLEAVTTVEVGTQVGGIIQELYADFNSIVKKGQVIARLDPTLLQTNIEQQRANVMRSEADLDRLKVALADSKQKLDRAKALFDKSLLPRTELETADVNVRSAEAQIRSAEAGLTQARSQLNSAEVNLNHTVIKAPIDGIVISRAVEPGQTVNAGMSAPTLFVLAADLTKMQVDANIDESDVGRMRPGQTVTFRVDAYPNETFTGAVEQVRLQPTTVQNVVTYQTVIEVPNQQMKLKPGMTATVTIEVARKNGVLRVPAAATRFRPSAEVFAALKQDVPQQAQRGRSNGANATGAGQPAQARPNVNAQSATRAAGQQGRVASVPSIKGGATTVDALFGPLPTVETRGTVWLFVNKQLKPVRLRLGTSDGANTEVLDANELPVGAEVVTSVILPTATTQAAGTTGTTSNPLMGPQRGGPGGRGGPPGGGR
jgi:HlyD family secretion protein